MLLKEVVISNSVVAFMERSWMAKYEISFCHIVAHVSGESSFEGA